jgi:hypothetical protein
LRDSEILSDAAHHLINKVTPVSLSLNPAARLSLLQGVIFAGMMEIFQDPYPFAIPESGPLSAIRTLNEYFQGETHSIGKVFFTD